MPDGDATASTAVSPDFFQQSRSASAAAFITAIAEAFIENDGAISQSAGDAHVVLKAGLYLYFA
jgi:hypothetical protein